MKTINDIIEEVFSLYEQHGSEDYIGEPVSQLEHMSQAAELARSRPNLAIRHRSDETALRRLAATDGCRFQHVDF
jgi:hypothetical protein